jgi:hypothetical protein
MAVGASGGQAGTPDIALLFSGQPTANDTLTLNGTVFTFIAGASSGTNIQIGANIAATLANAVTRINAEAVGSLITASASSPTLTITSDTTGIANNNFTVSWAFASATINADGSGASTTGNRTLDGGTITLTGGSGFKAIEIFGDGSVRFTTAGGQMVSIRSIEFNKLLRELILDSDGGLGPNHKLFGVSP